MKYKEISVFTTEAGLDAVCAKVTDIQGIKKAIAP